jgi:hypothetical protein
MNVHGRDFLFGFRFGQGDVQLKRSFHRIIRVGFNLRGDMAPQLARDASGMLTIRSKE